MMADEAMPDYMSRTALWEALMEANAQAQAIKDKRGEAARIAHDEVSRLVDLYRTALAEET